MNKLKLITTFILLVSLFLGVVACTPDEESKAASSADVSEDVSVTVSDEVSEDVSDVVSEDVSMEESGDISENESETISEDVSTDESEDESEIVSADMSTDESEDEPDVSIDENTFQIRNQLKPYGQGEIILVDKYKGDRKLYMVMLSTSDSIINEKVIADAFYDEYGLTFSEAFEKYCDDPEDHEKRVEAFDKIEADVSPLLPAFKEKMMNELKSIYNSENIILDERLIEDLADVVVTEPEMSFYPYRIQLLVYANPAEAEMLEEEYSIVAFGERYGWDNFGDGVYRRLSYILTMVG